MMLSAQSAQSAGGHAQPASLDDIKMLEMLLSGEPDVISVGADAAELMCPDSWRVSTVTFGGADHRMDEDGGCDGDELDGGGDAVMERKPSAAELMHSASAASASVATTTTTLATAVTTGNVTECTSYAVPELLSVLSDLYDKELVGVIGWAKQIPGK